MLVGNKKDLCDNNPKKRKITAEMANTVAEVFTSHVLFTMLTSLLSHNIYKIYFLDFARYCIEYSTQSFLKKDQ